MRKWLTRGFAAGALLTACLLWAGSTALQAFQAQAKFAGTWQLNVAASTNPNGPEQAAAAERGGGRGGGGDNSGRAGSSLGGGEQGMVTASGGKASAGDTGGTLSPAESQRLHATLKWFQMAPTPLTIVADAKQFNMTYPSDLHFDNVVGKSADRQMGQFGKIEMKVEWTGKTFKRESNTPDALKIIEEYTLSDDGKQMTVAITVKSGMERLSNAVNPTIKRVYDRAQ